MLVMREAVGKNDLNSVKNVPAVRVHLIMIVITVS